MVARLLKKGHKTRLDLVEALNGPRPPPHPPNRQPSQIRIKDCGMDIALAADRARVAKLLRDPIDGGKDGSG